MKNDGLSQIFGSVAVILGTASLYLGMNTQSNAALQVTWIIWGAIFLLVGMTLLAVHRMF